ncbi:mucin-2 [Wyeomyia smithii]|uniref:mucin-2 n=1 Tax=Wyeomyia smithii TaxID=174621 RepID=UPI002467DC4B|nr:mucin-2 [Wyeomyia smithii]XP_055547724.1 mucin-2 [Wyeomyia smithii]XP_055547726.1 mucin-2 [Wyeomyia smithii]
MESIYGTNKKYMQSLTAGSDFYRCPSTIRPMAADYSTYHNTMGRRSTLMGGGAPYTHMNKYSYPTDMSLSSHYGYTSWGLWRDNRNLSSSMYGKKQKNFRSVSVLLLSAAFIVVLAILCVVGLAFYLSAFKSDLSESILVFDCTFRVTRGDIYTTGLRSNHTSVFRQKSAFYERLIGTSLEQSGLTVSRTEIMDFGDGPTIVLSFRVFLDMRKIKITINNVEEHIRQAVLSELVNPHSLFRHIKVDPDSIEIKRLLDKTVLRTAFLAKEEFLPSPIKPLEDRFGPAKKSGIIEKTIHKFTAKVASSTVPSVFEKKQPPEQPQQHQQQDGESDIDMDNLPVIQGSFEITKTDADITQKRNTGGGTAGTVAQPVSTLKPFAVSPAQLKVRAGDKKPHDNVKISYAEENTTSSSSTMRPGAGARLKYETGTAKIEKTDKHGATTKKIKTNSGSGSRGTSAGSTATRRTTASTSTSPLTTTTTTSTTTVTTPTTTPSTTTTPRTTLKSTTSVTTTPALTVESATKTSLYEEYEWLTESPANDQNGTLLENFLQALINDSLPDELVAAQNRMDENIPKLDVSLFTSAPILDKQPWQPIRPSIPKEILLHHKFTPTKAPKKKPTLAEEILYRNKISDIESSLYTESPVGQIYYQSFTNPSFGSSTLGIEPLGVVDVKPYPLPVDKISIEPVPDFKVMTPTAISVGEQVLNYTLDDQRFEHLGGGVIAKKPESKIAPYKTTTDGAKTSVFTVTPVYMPSSSENVVNSTDDFSEYYFTDGLKFTDVTTMVNEDFNDTLLDYAMSMESRISPDDEEVVSTTENFMTSTMDGGANSVESLTEMSLESGSNELLMAITDQSEDLTTGSTTELFVTSTEVTTEQPKTSTSKRTTFVEVETLKYTPTTSMPTATVTVPELFPINKWEFVNGSRLTTANSPSTRKVYNETLQALVVENIQLTTTIPSVKIASLKRNTTKLQNLSSIFDTLASKLGIQTESSSKTPPFSSLSKIKNQYKNSVTRNSTKNRTRTTTRPKRKKNKNNRRTSTTTTSTTTGAPLEPSSTTTSTTPTPIFDTTPFAKPIPTITSDDLVDVVPVMIAPTNEYSSEQYIGQAEVEVIDPNKYDEMLRLLSTTPPSLVRYATTTAASPASLVTLLPAKSNSGIKNFRPKIKLQRRPTKATSSGSLAADNQPSPMLVSVDTQATGAGGGRSDAIQNSKLINANKSGAAGQDGVTIRHSPDDNVAGGGATDDGTDDSHRGSSGDDGSRGFNNQNDNKNNTMVETVVRASMRFES